MILEIFVVRWYSYIPGLLSNSQNSSNTVHLGATRFWWKISPLLSFCWRRDFGCHQKTIDPSQKWSVFHAQMEFGGVLWCKIHLRHPILPLGWFKTGYFQNNQNYHGLKSKTPWFARCYNFIVSRLICRIIIVIYVKIRQNWYEFDIYVDIWRRSEKK